MRIFFLAVHEKDLKKVKITKTADGFWKAFPKWPRNLIEGMELRICFATSLLSWTLLRLG